jgi:CubicO group peptidase (beta-lactamase class C family)
VTKLATTMAVLVAFEEGILGLDDPAGPPGATVAHLLAHTSGLGPDDDTVLVSPGRRRIYSTRGFEILAERVTSASALPFAQYLEEAVLGPLGMVGASLPEGTSAGSGMWGTTNDLTLLAEELLHPRLIHPSTLARATVVAFPGLAGVLPGFGRQDPCDWGLGFELRDAKRPHWTGTANSPQTFGHFGQEGGFLWVDPVAEVACAVLTDEPFGAWAVRAWPPLADAVLAAFAVPGGGEE